jgi:quercetin dioxygenase-like cupin family protein
MDEARTVTNPVTGETVTFIETSRESSGARVVMTIELAPSGAVRAHSHRVAEQFECIDGTFVVHHDGRDMPFRAGDVMMAEPFTMHGFRNDTSEPATVRVTVTPAGDLDRVLRTLAGLARDGRLVPGKPPKDPFAMAAIAVRGRYYEPPMPRWLYWPFMSTMGMFGSHAADRLMARYDVES